MPRPKTKRVVAVHHYGLVPKPADYQPRKRKCLGLDCDREFFSAGPGVRICPACKKRQAGQNLSRAESLGVID